MPAGACSVGWHENCLISESFSCRSTILACRRSPDGSKANAIAAQRPSRPLRAALGDLTARDPEITRSRLEERFLALLDAQALPRPIVNPRINGHEVESLETDGTATHLTGTAFQHDRTRDVQHTIAGYRVARFTYAEIAHRPAQTARAIRALLRAG